MAIHVGFSREPALSAWVSGFFRGLSLEQTCRGGVLSIEAIPQLSRLSEPQSQKLSWFEQCLVRISSAHAQTYLTCPEGRSGNLLGTIYRVQNMLSLHSGHTCTCSSWALYCLLIKTSPQALFLWQTGPESNCYGVFAGFFLR